VARDDAVREFCFGFAPAAAGELLVVYDTHFVSVSVYISGLRRRASFGQVWRS
jgi:hypothetical protein